MRELNREYILNKFYVVDDKGAGRWNTMGLAKYLIEELKIINVRSNQYSTDCELAFYDEERGVYSHDMLAVSQYILQANPASNIRFRAEVMDLIKLLAPFKYRSELLYKSYIMCNNGYYSLLDGTLHPYSDDIVIFSKLNADYDPSITSCPVVDKMLDKLTLGDNKTKKLLFEMFGYAMYRSLELQKCFILKGRGSNGKSTLLKFLRNILGNWNVSSSNLTQLNEKFGLATIVDKYANIIMDQSNNYIKDSQMFKSLVCGENLTGERKFKDSFDISNNFCTLILNANEIPNCADKTDGYYRRFIIVPFKATFTPNDADYDPTLDMKLDTDICKSYMLNKSIEALNELLMFEQFTETDETVKAIEEYKIDTDPVREFIIDKGGKIDYYIGRSVNDLFIDFNAFYEETHNGKAQTYMTRTGFTQKIKDLFPNVDVDNRWQSDKRKTERTLIFKNQKGGK